MRAKSVLGKSGEQMTAEYLQSCKSCKSCGLRILNRNWRSADGEIDIVAVERHVLVVCEVKSRTSTRYAARSRRSAGPNGTGCASLQCVANTPDPVDQSASM